MLARVLRGLGQIAQGHCLLASSVIVLVLEAGLSVGTYRGLIMLTTLSFEHERDSSR